MECGAPPGIHGGDPEDDPGGSQGSQYWPQDHEAPRSVVDWEERRPQLGNSGREPIPASKDDAGK